MIKKMQETFKTNPLTERKYISSKWLIFWGLLTFVGILMTASYYVGRVSSGQSFDIFSALNSQMLRFQIWAAMSLIIVFLDYKFRSLNQNWTILFPVHLLASFFWSVIALSIFFVLFWTFDGLINSTSSSLAEVFSNGLDFESRHRNYLLQNYFDDQLRA